MTLLVYDNNVDKVRPGDRIQIVGIYRVTQSKVSKVRKAVKTIFNTHLDVISFSTILENMIKVQDSGNIFYNDDDKNLFTKIADSPTVLNDLV